MELAWMITQGVIYTCIVVTFGLTIYNSISNRGIELGSFEARLAAVEDGLKTLVSKFDRFLVGVFEPVRQGQSPVQLTDFGIVLYSSLVSGMDSEKLIKNYLPQIDVSDEHNKYQIQQVCFNFASDTLLDVISQQEREQLEKVAFDKGAPMESLLGVLGVKFRDAKFKELGKSLEHIDTHAP